MADPNHQAPRQANIKARETAEIRSPDRVDEMLAQKVSTITVPAPEANKVVTVRVEAGRTLQLRFSRSDVVNREVVEDDLVLTFRNGGKVVFQDYMEAFGLMADIPTRVVQADGRTVLLPDLLDFGTGAKTPPGSGRQTDDPAAPIVVDIPATGEDKVVNLRFGRSVRFKFNSDDVAATNLEDDGSLTLVIDNGSTIRLVDWQVVAAKAELQAIFDDRSVALLELVTAGAGGGGDDIALDGTNNFTQVDIGTLGPGIGHLGPLGDETLRTVFEEPDPFLALPVDGPDVRPAGDPVQNDLPEAKDDKFFVRNSALVTTDVVIIFDHSGSMGGDLGVTGFATRLELARHAVAQLVGQPGVQNVMVVGFDNDATHANWGTPAEALAVIDSFIVGGTTNYAAAIRELMDNFDTAANPRPPAADVTNVYFLSDGVPVPDTANLGSNGLVGPWEAFLAANNIDTSFAVGVGAGISGGDADLGEISFPNGDPGNPIILLDEADLAGTLLGTLPSSVTGNILADNGNGADTFGNDGAGQIESITVDGVTYVYNAADDTITPTAGPVIAGSTLNVATMLGGQLVFEFAHIANASQGDFAYTAPDVDMDAEETFTYSIIDSDGDRSEANFDICIANGAPCAPEMAVAAAQQDLLMATWPQQGAADDAYYVFGAHGPALASLADIGVTSGGDLVLAVDDDTFDDTHLFVVFRAGGDGIIDLGVLGDMDGDSIGDAKNALVLDFQDVLDLSELAGGLIVHGRDGDAVSADLRGHAVAAEDHGAFTRYVIDGGSAQLDIDKVVQQNIVTDLG